MKKNFIPVLYFFATTLFFCACQKTDSPDENNRIGALTPFSVSVLNRTPPMAIINWTDAVDLVNGNPVRYKIYLNNTLVDSNLTRTRDTLTGLSGDIQYSGKVLAYTAQGDTASATFILEKVQAYIAYNSSSVFQVNDLYSGTRLWSKTWPSSSFYDGSPTIVGDTVYFSNNNLGSIYDNLYAANLKTGAPIWSGKYLLEPNTNPVVDNDKLFVSTFQGLVSLNRHTGSLNWIFNDAYLYSTPVVTADKVFVFTARQYMLAINKSNGTLAWQFPSEQSDIRPLVIPGLLVYGTVDGRVYALNQSNGTLAWQKNFPVSYFTGPVYLDNNVLIVYAGQDGLYGLNPTNGNTIWYRRSDWLSEPFLARSPGIIYFNDQDLSKLSAINTANGSILLETTCNEFQLFYANQKIYSIGDRKIYTRDASNGQVIDLVHMAGIPYYITRPTIRINDNTYFLFEHGNYK